MKRLLDHSDTSVVSDAAGATRHEIKVSEAPAELQRVHLNETKSFPSPESQNKKARVAGPANQKCIYGEAVDADKSKLYRLPDGSFEHNTDSLEQSASKKSATPSILSRQQGHDASKDNDGDSKPATSEMKKKARSLNGRRLTFPDKLMNLLNSTDFQDSMCWLRNGNGFALHPNVFMKKILPKHFEGTKFESFTRKLNRWGFKRIAGEDTPEDTYAYSHHLFKRDCPDLCRGMSGGKKAEQDMSHLSRFRQRGLADVATPLDDGRLSGFSALGAGQGLGMHGLHATDQIQLQQMIFDRQFATAGINPNLFLQHQQQVPVSATIERELALREMLLQHRQQQISISHSTPSHAAIFQHQQRLRAADFEAQERSIMERAALLQQQAGIGLNSAGVSELLFRREQEGQAAMLRLHRQSAFQSHIQDLSSSSAQARAMSRLRGPFGGM